jgi:glycosyltransferase involved in cell wall biosynthesis
MGFRVELLFLDPVPADRMYLRLHADYLASADVVALRQSLRFGSHFVSRDPKSWVKHAVGRIRSTMRSKRSDQSRRARPWHLPPPGNEGLAWARQRLSAFKPNAVVANYFNASLVFDLVDSGCCKAILSHDMFALRKESYQACGYALDFDERMIAGEAAGLAAADLCLAITERDADFARERHPHLRAVVFPYVLEAPAQAATAPPARRCLFVGSDNDPNRRALAWLLQEVWDRVAASRPDAELRIVGNLAAGDEWRQRRNVTFTGPVDDLAQEYAAATVALVPLRAGSGLKIKLIEALAHGVPAVATGASSDFLRIHDDAEGFAAAIGEMLGASDREARSREARAFAEAHYSAAAAEAALRRAFAQVKGVRIQDREQEAKPSRVQ